jgi:hypothetical protein
MQRMPSSVPPAPTALPSNPRSLLYSSTLIFALSILGSPLVGGILSAMNWKRVGAPSRANKSLALAGGAVVAMVLLGVFVPDSMPSLARGGSVGVTMAAAVGFRNEQRQLVEAHLAQGGKLASPWGPLLVTVAVIGALLAALVALAGGD